MNAAERRELEGLITALLEQEIRAEDHARLEQMLREDDECRRHYLAAADQHARLLHAPALAGSRPAGAAGRHPVMSRTITRGLPLAAAAAVALLGGALYFFRGAPETLDPDQAAEQTENGCAVLAQALDAKFGGENPPQPGAMLKPGMLRLESGLARIEFFSGATLLLEGSAELEIVSAWEAACEKGKVRVRVPPPAQGFRLRSPGMNLVDLGTEFAVQVEPGGASQVQVFEGEVEAHPEGAEMRLLKGGESARCVSGKAGLEEAGAAAVPFISLEQFDLLSSSRAQTRHDAWWAWFQEMRTDRRLIACYAFKHWKDDRWDRLVNNFTEPKDGTKAGAAVGVRWTHGRWPMKDALEFKGPGDRVRINLGREVYQAVTLACWVRVDALDRKYNALLLTDGYESGEPHWQIYEDGRLMFSIAYPDPAQPAQKKARYNQIYYSPSIFNLANQRRWHHIAVSYDGQSGEAVQYLDGMEISREVSPNHQPGRAVSFGPSEIGNWGLPTEGHKFPIRNLNGSLDEFLIYKAALSGAELRQIHEAGRPD